MIFDLNEEAQEFQRSLRRFFEKESDSEKLRFAIVNRENGENLRARIENAFSAFALNELFASPDQALASIVELVLVARESGRALCPAYLLEHLVAGPLFFSTFISPDSYEQLKTGLGEDLLSGLCRGEHKVVRSAHFYNLGNGALARLSRDGAIVSGIARLVPLSDQRSFLLYQADEETFLIDNRHQGVVIEQEQVLDLTRSRCRITYRNAPAYPITLVRAEQLSALSRVLISAELLGAVEKALAMTVQYSKDRQQFSRPIGSFQAVQHALADIYLKVEKLDSLLSFVVWSLAQATTQKYAPEQCLFSSQALLRFAVRECVGIMEKTIQIHGGIGFTWEYDLHLYLRRVRSLVALAGDQSLDDGSFLKMVRHQAGI